MGQLDILVERIGETSSCGGPGREDDERRKSGVFRYKNSRE